MPYFVDESNTVVVTLTGERTPAGVRAIEHSVGDGLRLRHGQKLSQERVECALAGDIEGFQAASTEYTPPPVIEPANSTDERSQSKPPMLMSTTPFLNGWTIIETLGLVAGNTIRARNVLSRTGAGLKSLVGGELAGLVKALTDSREEAVKRMVEAANALGADAIVGVSFSASEIFESATEILVSGTAVRACVAGESAEQPSENRS